MPLVSNITQLLVNKNKEGGEVKKNHLLFNEIY